MDVEKQKQRPHWFHGKTSGLDQESLNLVEFPLALLARQIPADQKVVSFSDSIKDQSTGQRVERKLTISANAETQLPNYWDQDALLALTVLTWRKNRFSEPVVQFTLREVLRLMNVSGQGANCKRLAKSFDNWLGLRFKWTHWWNGETWENPKATVLIQDYDLTRKPGNIEPNQPQTFAWSRLYFEAMQPGKCKPLDADFYFGLKKPVTKRLYRYLDKRFFNRVNYNSPVSEFCTEKLGMARGRKPSQYPERIRAAYDELVFEGFLADLPASERFVRDRSGLLQVNFKRGRGRITRAVAKASEVNPHSPIEKRLIELGMTVSVATKWASEKGDECERQVEYLEFKLAEGWVSKNGNGGYLNLAIRDEYAAPKGFVSKQERAAKTKQIEEKRNREKQAKAAAVAKQKQKEQAEEKQLRDFIERLGGESERQAFEERAISNGNSLLRTGYLRAKGGGMEKTYLSLMLREQMEREQA